MGRRGAGGGFLVQFFGLDVPVVLQQFQQFFDLKVPQIQFIDRVLACSCAAATCTHGANCADDRRVSSVGTLGLVLDMPVVVHRQVPFHGCQGRRHLCRGAEAVSLGPDCSENHSDSPVAVH